MKSTINSNPLEFEGLRHKQKVQRTVAQLPPGQNKERPPLTMEPSIDDPLATTITLPTQAIKSFSVTPAQAGVQSKDLDSRFRGNDGNRGNKNTPRSLYRSGNKRVKSGGAAV